MDQMKSSSKMQWISGIAMVMALFVLPVFLNEFGRTGEYWIWVSTEMIIMALIANNKDGKQKKIFYKIFLIFFHDILLLCLYSKYFFYFSHH